ncbi:MAG: sulfurtransferase TusA family protein [Pseudomonadota bacterium]
MDAACTIDARWLSCPLPVLKARKRLAALAVGERLVLLATDPATERDVPAFCTETGHRLVGLEKCDDGVIRFLVEKGS